MKFKIIVSYPGGDEVSAVYNNEQMNYVAIAEIIEQGFERGFIKLDKFDSVPPSIDFIPLINVRRVTVEILEAPTPSTQPGPGSQFGQEPPTSR